MANNGQLAKMMRDIHPTLAPQPVLVVLNEEMITRACRAHWPSWERMRPDLKRAWREKMTKALQAAVYG